MFTYKMIIHDLTGKEVKGIEKFIGKHSGVLKLPVIEVVLEVED